MEKIGEKKVEITNCPDSLLLLLSIANKLDRHDQIANVQMLNFIGLGLIMALLLYFRKA